MAPPDTWLKLNSDDSDHLHNLAACGGVLRDDSVSFMRAFAANVGSCPVVVAELWGACYALEVAYSLGQRKIILEMDYGCAVMLIRKTWDKSHPFSTLIGRIHHLVNRSWEVHIAQIYREANKAADFMASKGHSLDCGLIVFCEPPLGLSSILLEDIRGVALPRMIH